MGARGRSKSGYAYSDELQIDMVVDISQNHCLKYILK